MAVAVAISDKNLNRQYTESSNPLWPDLKAQPRSFFKAPLCTDLDDLNADVAFIGMPFNQGTFGKPGARFGPDAIRDASRTYSYADPYGQQKEAEGFFDIDIGGDLLSGVTMADYGHVTTLLSNVLNNFDKLTRSVGRVVSLGAFPVVVGGDHAITYQLVRGMSKFAPLNIVHFDAHLVYSHDYQGVLHTDGSPIRRCQELPFVKHITSVGIRTARRRPYEASQKMGV